MWHKTSPVLHNLMVLILAAGAMLVPVLADCTEDDQAIRIGVLLPLTGDYAPLGQELRKGIELGLSEQAASRKISVIFEDIGSINSQVAVSSAKKLAEIDGVQLALCTFVDDAEPIGPIFTARKIPLMVLWDSTATIDRLGSYVFSNGVSTEKVGAAIADYAATTLHLQRVAVVSQSTTWATIISKAFEDRLRAKGAEIVQNSEIPLDTTDFKSIVTRLRLAAIQGVFFPLAANPSLFLKELLRQRVSTVLLSSDTMLIPGEVDSAGAAAEGVCFGSVFRDHLPELSEKYTALFKSPPSDVLPVSFGYDGILVAVQAVEMARRNRSTVQEALLKLLGPKRRVDRPVAIFEIRSGQAIKLP